MTFIQNDTDGRIKWEQKIFQLVILFSLMSTKQEQIIREKSVNNISKFYYHI